MAESADADVRCQCSHSSSAHGLRGYAGCSFCSCERFERPVVQRPKVHLTSYAQRALELMVKNPAFKGTPREALELFLAEGHGRIFQRGEMLIHRGDASRVLHVIIDGQVTLESGQPAEGEQRPQAVHLGPSEIAADLRAFSGEPRWASVTASETVDALAVDTSKLKPVFAEFPDLFMTLAKTLALHTDSLDELVEATLSTALDQYSASVSRGRRDGLDPQKAQEIRERWRELKEMDSAEDRARAALRNAINQQTSKGKRGY